MIAFQKFLNPFGANVKRPNLAFPNRQNRPAVPFQVCVMLTVPFPVAGDFPFPILPVRFRNSGAAPAIVSMPKATMDKNNFSPGGKNQIRLSGQIFPMQPIAVAHGENHTTNRHFRGGIASLDRPHDPGSFRVSHHRRYGLAHPDIATASVLWLAKWRRIRVSNCIVLNLSNFKQQFPLLVDRKKYQTGKQRMAQYNSAQAPEYEPPNAE